MASTGPGRLTSKKANCQVRNSPKIGKTTGGAVEAHPITAPPMIKARPTPATAPMA